MLARRLLIAGGSGGFTIPEEAMRELAYAENTSVGMSVTSTSWASPDTVVTAPSITADGITAIIIEVGVTSIIPPSVSEWINLGLYDGSTLLGIMGGAQNDGSVGAGNVHTPFFAQRRLTPSAGAHVYKIGAVVATGTGHINFGPGGASPDDMPAYVRVVTAG